MYKEVNTGTNLPAQIDLYAVDGDEYKFLLVSPKVAVRQTRRISIQETKSVTDAGKTEKLSG